MPKYLVERRQYERFGISCPSKITLGMEKELKECRAINVSDGGILLEVPAEALPDRDSVVKLTFSVPRTTPNTYMLEDFTTTAKVIRHQVLAENGQAGVALQFSYPLQLALNV